MRAYQLLERRFFHGPMRKCEQCSTFQALSIDTASCCKPKKYKVDSLVIIKLKCRTVQWMCYFVLFVFTKKNFELKHALSVSDIKWGVVVISMLVSHIDAEELYLGFQLSNNKRRWKLIQWNAYECKSLPVRLTTRHDPLKGMKTIDADWIPHVWHERHECITTKSNNV